MKRAPFKMLPHRQAQTRTRRDGRPPMGRGGRASYCWQWNVLVPIACGTAPYGVEIRLAGTPDRQHPWHLIDYTPDEAYALIREHYNAGTKRLVDGHRRRRGLTVA